MRYTFKSENREKAIEMAAQIATDGKEATVSCGKSRFTASPFENHVSEFVGGKLKARHSFEQKIEGGKWQFAGITESVNF